MAPAGGNSPPAPPGVGRACGSPSHAIKREARTKQVRDYLRYFSEKDRVLCPRTPLPNPCRKKIHRDPVTVRSSYLHMKISLIFRYLHGRYPSFVGRLSVVRARHRPVCRAEQPSWVRSGVSSVDSSGVQQFTSYHASYHASYIIVYRIIGPSRCGPAIIGRAPGYEKAARGLRPGSAPAACPRSGGNEKGL